MSNIISEHIEVFPAGFRGSGYGQSKLFTENNITYLRLLSSHKDNNDAVFINPYDNSKVIIILGGYLFNVIKADIDNCISSTANMYAVIRVRAVTQSSEDYVLCSVEGTSTSLDVTVDNNVLFKGLSICTSTEKSAITEDSTHKVFSIQISDANKQLITKNYRLSTDEIKNGTNDESIAKKLTTESVVTNALTTSAYNGDSTINTSAIVNDAVTSDKIADKAIISSKINTFESEDIAGEYRILCKLDNNNSLFWNSSNRAVNFNLKVNTGASSAIFDARSASTLNLVTDGKLSADWNSETNKLTLTGGGSTVSTSSTQGNISVDEKDVSVKGLTTNDSPTFKGLTLKSINDADTTEYSSNISIEAGHNSTKGNLVIESNSNCNIQLINNATDGNTEGTTSMIFHKNGDKTGSTDFSNGKINFNCIVSRDNHSANITFDPSTNDEHFIMDKPLTIDGKCTANSFLATSDIRKKTNITPFTAEKSILDLNVYKYDYINDDTTHIGCIAQELKTICPELVHEDSEGYLSIEESKLVYLLIDEVKKLKEEVNKLKGE